MFPLLKKGSEPVCKITKIQKDAIERVKEKIKTGEYKLVENQCLCGKTNKNGDLEILDKDRYGFPISSLLCSRCGLIRSEFVFDETSNLEFYKKDYREIYVGSKIPPDSFFHDQLCRGNNLFKRVREFVPMEAGMKVFEIGCGAGGILYPFAKADLDCSGCDYDEEYLEYGRLKGLNLNYGDYNGILHDNEVDILILSHVMEHFLDPIKEIQQIIAKIKPLGWLIIEVPGIFYIDRNYGNPILYLQNAHVYSYYEKYLKVLFEQMGLLVKYSDESCLFILQKPKQWKVEYFTCVFDSEFKWHPDKIKKYLIKTHLLNSFHLNPYKWRSKIVEALDFAGLKKPIKKWFVK